MNGSSLTLSEKTNFELVKEFHETFGIEVGVDLMTLTPKAGQDLLVLRKTLIEEEYNEVEEELLPVNTDAFTVDPEFLNKEKLTKELADLLYVTYGTAVSLGLPIDEAFRLVHESNMSKLEDGKVLRRDDGKVLKGKNYKEPDLSVLFK